MVITDLITRISEVTPLIAIRSLSLLEEPFDSSSEMRVVEDPDVEGGRLLYIGNNGEPAVSAKTTGNRVAWQVLDAQIPADLRLALAAIGTKIGVSELDLEEFDDRVENVDHAWCLARRIRLSGADGVSECANRLMAFAAAWQRNRGLIFDTAVERPVLKKERERLEQQARDLVAENPGWLRSIRLYPDPRGSALSLSFVGREHDFDLSGVSLDWPVDAKFGAGFSGDVPRVGNGPYAVRPTKLDERVTAAISGALVDGNEVRLVKQLTPSLYGKVSSLFLELGASWEPSRQAHVFMEPAHLVLDPLVKTGYVFTRRDFEFFETQPREVNRVAVAAEIKPGMKVLEPSAGRGAIALMAAEIVGKGNVKCYELMPANAAGLRALGFDDVDEVDFLSIQPTAVYQRVILNPPFSGGRDIAHVLHALKFVRPGGRLVAITSVTWRQGRSKSQKSFQSLLQRHRATVLNIEAGAFSEVGTDVPTCLITIDVPEEISQTTLDTIETRPVSHRSQHAPVEQSKVVEQTAFDFA